MIDAIITGVAWIVGLAFVAVVGWFIYDEMQFKHKCIVRQEDDGSSLTRVVKTREVVDKDGSHWWKLKGFKEKIPRPPNNCIYLDNKGRFIAKFFQLDGGELKPVIDTSFGKVLDEHAITVSQRQIIVNQLLKVQRTKGKTWLELAYWAVPIMAVAMILIIFMIFFGEAVQPLVNLGNTNNELLTQANRILQRAEDISCGNRHLSDFEKTGGTPYPDIPPN